MATSTAPRIETIEVTDDFTLVIPSSLVASLGFLPGQKVQVIFYSDRVEFSPEVHPRDVRGTLPGLDTTIERDEDRI